MYRDEIEGWWKVPKKKKNLKTLQKDERMISPSLSLSLSLSLLTQVNMSTPNIVKHVGRVHCEIMKLNL